MQMDASGRTAKICYCKKCRGNHERRLDIAHNHMLRYGPDESREGGSTSEVRTSSERQVDSQCPPEDQSKGQSESLSDAPMYAGARLSTKEFVLEMLRMKAEHGATEEGIIDIMKLTGSIVPKPNTVAQAIKAVKKYWKAERELRAVNAAALKIAVNAAAMKKY
ncbi:unnamed protein product [Calypogeia fissa]